MYNSPMPDFRFYHPIEVRYGDLDPQGHVNNARYLTYLEQARVAYIRRLGLWEGGSFLDFNIILADAHVTYRAPVLFGQDVRVWVRVSRLGNKSFTMDYRLDDSSGEQEYAVASTVLVAYDHHSHQTIPIPASWRRVIGEFEGIPLDV